MIGKTISHYRILEKLGEGGMGVVYKAEDTRLHRPVALKFLPTQQISSQKEADRLAREAQAAARLNHPNIATIFEFCEIEDPATHSTQAFIAMEFVDGQILGDLLRKGPLPHSHVRRILAQIVKGLHVAHSRGIVHRDIKPSNIVLTADGLVKLLDFGVAKVLEETTISLEGAVVGSVAYMSPEQVRGEKVDQRSDLWSVGVLLFQMLTGRLPFRGEHSAAMMYAIANEVPSFSGFPEDVPADLVDACRQCLEKEKSRRPQSSQELFSLFEEPTASIEQGTSSRPVPILNRKSLFAGVLVIVMVLIALFIVPWSSQEPASPRFRLAVLPFVDLTRESQTTDWSYMLQAFLGGSLTGLEYAGIMDPPSLNGLLEYSFKDTIPGRGPRLKSLLQNASVRFVVDGNILRSGSSYQIRSSLVGVETGEALFSFETPLSGEEDLPQAAGVIAGKLIDFLDVNIVQARDDQNLRPWLQHRTKNFGALKAFREATQYIYRRQRGGEKFLRRALELDSTYISPRVWLIAGLVIDGNRQEAQRHYEFLQTLDREASPFERAMIEWCGAYLDENVPRQAQFLQNALEYSPGNNILLVNLAWSHFLMEQYDQALASLIPAISMKWRYAPLYPFAANCYLRLGKDDEAERLLLEALEIDPVDIETYSLLAALQVRKGLNQEAERYERLAAQRGRALGFSPDVFHWYLASSFLQVGVFEKAARYAKLAVDMNPRVPAYLDVLGDAYLGLKKQSEAEYVFRRILAVDSTWAKAWLKLGEVIEQSGDSLRARDLYRQFLKLDSVSSSAAHLRERLRLN